MEINPNETNNARYQEEFNKGIDLFDKSFHGYLEAKTEGQKEQYNKVMDESFQVMQDSASGMMNKHLQELKSQLQSDYSEYMENPNEQTKQKVEMDIQSLKQNQSDNK